MDPETSLFPSDFGLQNNQSAEFRSLLLHR
jgi:hypothetical protein